MQPRVSVTLILAPLILAQVLSAQTSDKPSPVPSRVRKQERPRALEAAATQPTQMAPTWTATTPSAPVNWDAPQSGTSVFFSDNVRGKAAASGTILNPDELIAAHASLPFGTLVKVTNIKNGKEVQVRIVDRISANSTHIISVSEKAASDLDFRRAGVGSVRILPVQP